MSFIITAVKNLSAWAQQIVEQRAAGQAQDLSSIDVDVFAVLAAAALERTQGNIAAAARLLGLKRHQLEYRLKVAEARATVTRG